MIDIIVGERVINKIGEIGTINSFDDKYIYVAYNSRTAKLQLDAFEQCFLKYENANLQNKVNESIAQARIDKEREKAAIAREKRAEDRRLVVTKGYGTTPNIKFESTSLRLNAAKVTFNSVRKGDRDLIQRIFDECDKQTMSLYESFNPKMEYPKYTSQSRSKYCVGFLCNYLETYVFRVFSRNDVYKKRKTDGITIMKSDTTEIFRALRINGRDYFFTKNLCYSLGYLNNHTSYNNWHISELGAGVMLNEVIRSCDSKYLNDYISTTNIECSQYIKLLIPAIHNNKAEIVFKNRLFSSTYRINDISGYLDEFTPRQIDFASKNNVVNALPIIKCYGIYDLDILRKMESLMKKRRFNTSIYDNLEGYLKRKFSFDCSDLGKKVINFLKKIDYFDAALYNDYIYEIYCSNGTSVDDFFDKNYIDRHNIMMAEKSVTYTKTEEEAYEKIAKELSWIDRQEKGYYIIVPKTICEFRREGEMQHNCVYTNKYYDLVIKRHSIIVFLRKAIDCPYVTIEFDYETFDVLQAYGKYNKAIDSDLYHYIINLGRHLNYERFSQQ